MRKHNFDYAESFYLPSLLFVTMFRRDVIRGSYEF